MGRDKKMCRVLYRVDAGCHWNLANSTRIFNLVGRPAGFACSCLKIGGMVCYVGIVWIIGHVVAAQTEEANKLCDAKPLSQQAMLSLVSCSPLRTTIVTIHFPKDSRSIVPSRSHILLLIVLRRPSFRC